jgi:hypothetical protein
MGSKLLRSAPRRHTARKSYSYRYMIPDAVGPDGLVLRAGAAIIETRYRGRSATWQVRLASGETWEVSGSFVEPRADNMLAYPERVLPAPAADSATTEAVLTVPVQSHDTCATPPHQAGTEVPTMPLPPAAAKPPAPPAVRESAGDKVLREFHRALLSSGSFDPVVS